MRSLSAIMGSLGGVARLWIMHRLCGRLGKKFRVIFGRVNA